MEEIMENEMELGFRVWSLRFRCRPLIHKPIPLKGPLGLYRNAGGGGYGDYIRIMDKKMETTMGCRPVINKPRSFEGP